MNTRGDSAVALAKGVVDAVGNIPTSKSCLCPPSVYLAAVADAVAGTPVGAGSPEPVRGRRRRIHRRSQRRRC